MGEGVEGGPIEAVELEEHPKEQMVVRLIDLEGKALNSLLAKLGVCLLGQ